MKLRNLLFVSLMILALSCNDRTLEQLNERNQELAQIKKERDSVLNQLDSTLIALEKHLGIQESEINRNLSERIRYNIGYLDNMIQENEKKVRNLRAQNRNSNKQYDNLMAELEANQQALEKRQRDLENLNQQVARMDRKIKSQDSLNVRLTNQGSSQARKMEELNQRLNTAYVIVGKFKELKDKELVEKKGGFLNIFGRVPKLDPDYNKGLFATINIRKDTVLELNVSRKDIKMVTVHPMESFQLLTTGENTSKISIKDPDRFWEASKFLVIAEK